MSVHQITHPMVTGVDAVRSAIGDLGVFEPVYVPTEQKPGLVTGLLAAEAQLAALRLRVLATCGDVADRTGAKDPAAWLIGTRPVDPTQTRADARLATALDRWPATALALAAGRIGLEQARVITTALDDVVDELDTTGLRQAEQIMLEAADQLDPARLRKTGRRLVDLVCPEQAEEREAKRLAEEDKHAAEKAKLSLRPQGDGTTRISGRVPTATAKKLETFLESFAQPRKQAAAADGRRISYPTLMARALGDLLDRIAPETLPAHGGDATTMIITITLDQLRTGLGSAGLGFDDDTPISAAQARRMACQAHLIPMVLDSQSQVLDAGRRTRLHYPMQRKVIRLRDHHCIAHGCTVKAQWCEIHHLTPWSQGGHTTVDDGALLCSHHHDLIHDPTYLHQRLPDGTIRFTRRT